jgi:hypothetical protein
MKRAHLNKKLDGWLLTEEQRACAEDALEQLWTVVEGEALYNKLLRDSGLTEEPKGQDDEDEDDDEKPILF